MKKYRLLSAAAISLLLFTLLSAPLTAVTAAAAPVSMPGGSGMPEQPDTVASSSDAEPADGDEDGEKQDTGGSSQDTDSESNIGGKDDADGGNMFEDKEEDIALSEDELLPASPSSLLLPAQNDEAEYSFCGYDFYYAERPLELEFGYEFDEYNRPPETVDLYLDGPDGHIDDYFTLNVEWDLSDVDFSRPGSYLVTGSLDTDDFPYPLDWEQVPSPSFTLKIEMGGILSFQPRNDSDILYLDFIMNGEPFALPERMLTLYESRDGGENWYDITPSSRVRVSKTGIVITGMHKDAILQAIGLNLGGFYGTNSDFVKVNVDAGNVISSVSVISSDGLRWDTPRDNWHDYTFSESDGPFRILRYTAGSHQQIPLETIVIKDRPETLRRDFFSSVNVFYGDQPDGFWSKKLDRPIPVQWDWDSVDCSLIGDIVIYGTFSGETMEQYGSLLDFESMPVPALTVSVISDALVDDFIMEADWNRLLKNQTVYFDFYKGYSDELQFEELSGLTVWCSYDSGLNWYDITGLSNVKLGQTSLSVSQLKNSLLRRQGYSFQVEQKNRSDITPFSTALTIEHQPTGVNIGHPSGGDRGGGKRWSKPPEGLFEGDVTDSPDIKPEPPGTEPEPPVIAPEPDEPSGGEPPVTGPGDADEGDHNGGGNDSGNGNGSGNSSGGGNNGNDGNSNNGNGNNGNTSNGNNGNGDNGNTSNADNSNASSGDNGNTSGNGSGEETDGIGETGPGTVLPDPLPFAAARDAGLSLSKQEVSKNRSAAKPSDVKHSQGAVKPQAQSTPKAAASQTAATVSELPETVSPGSGTIDTFTVFRQLIGLGALILGGLAGYWMIRRR